MFTRHVIMQLKANSASEFTRTVEKEILPMLRKQKGFRDEITFISTDGMEAIANSFWDTKEDAEAYDQAEYPQVLKALSNVVEGTPRVGSAVVSNSTIHKIAAQAA
jgi:prophage antirepressor-like protein